jgi:hypothetical protein
MKSVGKLSQPVQVDAGVQRDANRAQGVEHGGAGEQGWPSADPADRVLARGDLMALEHPLKEEAVAYAYGP